MRGKRWAWILFSIGLAMLVGTLATTYNVALVRDYHHMLAVAQAKPISPPKWTVTLGSIGFATVLVGVFVSLLRLLREMKLNQLQSEFIAHVTHELKTPIATLELTSDLLRSDEPSFEAGTENEERQRLWQSHSEELQRLKHQVHDLLEAARWQSSPPKITRSSIHLGQWIQNSSPRWRELLGQGASLSIDGDPFDFSVGTNSQSMDLIFTNLIENARKFAKTTPQVQIRTRVDGPQWSISVRDFGWGFPKNHSKKIFSRFHRAPHGASYAIPGTGLGLHLSKIAAKTIGWNISASSGGPGQGAEFTLTGKLEKT